MEQKQKGYISDLQINHLTNPTGYDLSYQTFSWKYEAGEREKGAAKKAENRQEHICVTACRVEIGEDTFFENRIHDSGMYRDGSFVSYETKLELKPRTRYFWRVTAEILDGEKETDIRIVTSGISSFETGKCGEPWQAKWVSIKTEPCDEDIAADENKEKGIADLKERVSPIVRKTVTLKKKPVSSRIYVTGLGLYECYLNGRLLNDGYLQPGLHNYNYWLQYQTFELDGYLKEGENVISFLLGAGWYQGRFGVNGGFEHHFGKDYRLLCELHINYEDGTKEIVGTDGTFRYTDGPIRFSNIYDGEIFNTLKEPVGFMRSGFDDSDWKSVSVCDSDAAMDRLTERYSVPVARKEELTPIAVLSSTDGSFLLDMGQNMTGWVVFLDTLKRGEKLTLRFGELLEDGVLCRKNLRTAKAEFVYISDGSGRLVRPHFTYYGFRYVQIEGLETKPKRPDFTGWNLYSDLKTTGWVTTGNANVNRFISNAFWSQRDNFLDHPTDCPQRAERLGWTGDAQMYCSTACLTMDTQAFFRKYMKDVNEEQRRKQGMVPFIVPKIAGRGFEESKEDECSAAWSDVAVIIPWNLYLYYGDQNLLKEQYPGMKAWVDYIIRRDRADGDKKLWQSGFHFGDWLALDNPAPGPFGKTDPYYIASCYYYYSTGLLAKAAEALGYGKDASYYSRQAALVKMALRETYFDEHDICMQDTQTGYVLAIYMDLVPKEALWKNGEKLVEKITVNGGHLDTGFVGTAYLCQALSKAGFSEAAYGLLLKEDYPSWLYQVKQGATTVWESWDALGENGKLTAESSLNHYAFGSIVEWIYRDVCGINPIEQYPGFAKARIEPKPSEQLGEASAHVDTPYGRYAVSWKTEGKRVKLVVEVPDLGSAALQLENGEEHQLAAGIHSFRYEKQENASNKENLLCRKTAQLWGKDEN